MITFNDYYYGHNAHESWTRMTAETADGLANAFRDAFSDDFQIPPAINPSLRADALRADAINWFGPPTIRVPGRIPRLGEPRRFNEDVVRRLTGDIDFIDFF